VKFDRVKKYQRIRIRANYCKLKKYKTKDGVNFGAHTRNMNKDSKEHSLN